MMNKEKNSLADSSLIRKIQTLIVGRLLMVFLLLIASWVWNSGHLKLSYENFPRGLFLVFLISVGLTIVYFFVLRLSKKYYWQIQIQFLLDIFLITWLVWRTGDINSPYLTLYIVLISVAGIFVGTRGTLLTAILSVFSFSALSILTFLSIVPSVSTTSETPKVVQIVGFHIVAFLIVGLLSARLSEKYSSKEKLKEATKSLADLRVLHERIVESIRSGLITIDTNGSIYTFNKMAEEITGYKAQNVQGKSIFALFGDIKREIEFALAEDIHTTDIQPRYEIGFTTPDGFIIQLGYSVSPLFTEEGEKKGLIITFQDLTEIRSMEQSVRRKDRLSAVGRVAAGLAHEIRNPLGAMRGAIQILESQKSQSEAQANLMKIVLRESDRLNGIIKNFLNYARPKASEFDEIDIIEAIKDTMTLVKHSPDVKENHKLTMDLPEKSILMSADVSQLKQIFWNLSRNAIQAMQDGGTLNVALQEVGSNRIKIVFSDTGCGMSPKQVERLFEPFSESTTGGTGLGLSIVYQIVKDHNGTISVSSKENKGTDIIIHFPTDYVDKTPKKAVEIEKPEFTRSDVRKYLNINTEKNRISS